jgi:hypothetical protein
MKNQLPAVRVSVGMGAPLTIFSAAQSAVSAPFRAMKAITKIPQGFQRAKNAVAPCPTGYVRNGAGQCVPNQFGGSGGTARARPGTAGVGALPPVVVSAPVGMGAISLFSAKPDPVGNIFAMLGKAFARKGSYPTPPRSPYNRAQNAR